MEDQHLAATPPAPAFDPGQYIRALRLRGVSLAVTPAGEIAASPPRSLNEVDRGLLRQYRDLIVRALGDYEVVG